MSDIVELQRIAAVAAGKVTPDGIAAVEVEPGVGSTGDDILRIRVILSDTLEALGDERLFDILLKVQRDLRQTGDERLAVVSFATLAELADDADPES